MFDVTATINGKAYTLDIEDGNVIICVDGVYAGSGRVLRQQHGRQVWYIVECDASLSDDPDENDDIWEVLTDLVDQYMYTKSR